MPTPEDDDLHSENELIRAIMPHLKGPGVDRTEGLQEAELPALDAEPETIVLIRGIPANPPTEAAEPAQESGASLASSPDVPVATSESDYSQSENPLIRHLTPLVRKAPIDRTGLVPQMEGPRGSGPSGVLMVGDPTLSQTKPRPPSPPDSEAPRPAS